MRNNIIGAITGDDTAFVVIAELVMRQSRANGVLMKAINFVGGQAEGGLKMMPNAVRAQIDVAAHRALEASYDVARRSRMTHNKPDTVYCALSMLSGALGGLGGLPTALAELPVSTTIIFHGIQGVAAQYGENPQSLQTRMECLAVFGSGCAVAPKDGIDTSFFGARLGLTGAAVNGLIGRVAPRFATLFSQKLASQALPVLGAAAGASTNYAFTNYYIQMAHVHFGLRKLACKHGEQPVLDEFHSMLASFDVAAKCS